MLIAKLYVRDENDQPVGTLVLDMERVVAMFLAAAANRSGERPLDRAPVTLNPPRSEPASDPGYDMDEPPPCPMEDTPTNQYGVFVRKANETLGWYRRQDGSYHLAPLPENLS